MSSYKGTPETDVNYASDECPICETTVIVHRVGCGVFDEANDKADRARREQLFAERQIVHVWDLKGVVWSFLGAVLIEGASLWLMFLSLGHAGPEGRFAMLGWIGVGLNFPALLIARFLHISEDVSMFRLAASLFLIQLLPAWYLTFVLLRFCKAVLYPKLVRDR
jgi:RsiW-degrading membrane proteinase PrsW (M82 family)